MWLSKMQHFIVSHIFMCSRIPSLSFGTHFGYNCLSRYFSYVQLKEAHNVCVLPCHKVSSCGCQPLNWFFHFTVFSHRILCFSHQNGLRVLPEPLGFVRSTKKKHFGAHFSITNRRVVSSKLSIKKEGISFSFLVSAGANFFFFN